MGGKNGNPCMRCGASQWNKFGKCVSCSRQSREKYRKANRDKIAARNREWYKENSDRVATYGRKWKQENLDKHRAKEHRRRAKKTGAGGGYTAAEFAELCTMYQNRCLKCGRDDVKLTADHVIPVSKGGSSDISNIQPLCSSCNAVKHDKTIDYRTKSGIFRWIQKRLF